VKILIIEPFFPLLAIQAQGDHKKKIEEKRRRKIEVKTKLNHTLKKNEEDNRFIFGESLPEEHEGIQSKLSDVSLQLYLRLKLQ
jgi:hypothetical protein